MELKDLKGVGIKTESALNSLSIYTIDDLISYYPFRYNIIKLTETNEIKSGMQVTVEGIVENYANLYRINKKMDKLTFRINMNNKLFSVTIFNRGFLKNKLVPGLKITVIGKIDLLKNSIIASDIKFYIIGNQELIEPVYHSSSSISSGQLKKIISQINFNFDVKTHIPSELMIKYNFIDKKEALLNVHNPKDKVNLVKSINMLKYEEAYEFLTKLEKLKKDKLKKEGLKRNVDFKDVNDFIQKLPFSLTNDQLQAVSKIFNKLNDQAQTNALIQGDVGSGKTVVAIIAMYINYLSGYQSAMMVPTDVLAKQHFENLQSIFKNTNIEVVLLTGKMQKKLQSSIHKQIENNDAKIIVGTHALISDNVNYSQLGLVITDEQHRFGVNQRLKLKEKGLTPDIIYMSATPIPRTYALTLYNDMDIITIKEKPKGRKPILTKIKSNDEIKEVLTLMYQELKKNNQVYVVVPLIEQSDKIDLTNIEELEEKMRKAFGKLYKIGVMHGKMTEDDKNKIMSDFKNNDINILISTTVIEVGIDVKKATVMVIFDSYRFGLSTIHQLRGRVGRGEEQSYCILMSDYEKERLKILEKTDDGFLISESDFKLRGSGDLFGVRQSGDMLFKLLDIHQDYHIFETVKKDLQII